MEYYCYLSLKLSDLKTTHAALKYALHQFGLLGDGYGCRDIKCVSIYPATGMLSLGSGIFLTGLSGCY